MWQKIDISVVFGLYARNVGEAPIERFCERMVSSPGRQEVLHELHPMGQLHIACCTAHSRAQPRCVTCTEKVEISQMKSCEAQVSSNSDETYLLRA
jgi:hypothetical protein